MLDLLVAFQFLLARFYWEKHHKIHLSFEKNMMFLRLYIDSKYFFFKRVISNICDGMTWFFDPTWLIPPITPSGHRGSPCLPWWTIESCKLKRCNAYFAAKRPVKNSNWRMKRELLYSVEEIYSAPDRYDQAEVFLWFHWAGPYVYLSRKLLAFHIEYLFHPDMN